ncbi:MAG TPA: quinolinate synthase NadA [Candidatus Hydrogenedentes bacterium]|nr:quinolinate synthase NadA [Candidatus Hydrogenedentota bacterium]
MLNTETDQSVPTLAATRQRMHERLKGIVPPFEIDLKAEIAFQINRLKREKNAVILGHNYMEPALFHSVPDYVGDSLELSRISAQTEADIIVFCGVQFMAETAKILNPDKTVLIPALEAGCSLAAGISVEDVLHLKRRYPGVPVVSYVNTYADVKAVSDYCCTSGNADKVVRHILDQGHKTVIFLPDEYLARNTALEIGAPITVPERDADGKPVMPEGTEIPEGIIGWTSRCEVHEQFTVQDVQNVRKQFPDVVIIAHPECSPEVVEQCNFAGSTKQMVEYVQRLDAQRYLLLTECSMADNIAAENPDKEMLRLCSIRCPYMGLITLEDTLAALENLQYEIVLPADTIMKARTAIDHMLSIR